MHAYTCLHTCSHIPMPLNLETHTLVSLPNTHTHAHTHSFTHRHQHHYQAFTDRNTPAVLKLAADGKVS